MIKIQEHLELMTDDVESYLDKLVESHWNHLNPSFKNKKGFKQTSIIEKVKKYLVLTNNDAYIRDYAENDVSIAERHRTFFQFLIDNKFDELKKIVTSKPSEFDMVRKRILNYINEDDLYSGTINNYSQTAFGKLLSEKIFDYKTFRNSSFCKDLFEKLGFKSATCPYCNYNKLDIITIDSGSSAELLKKAYLDLDHFYPKLLHPFFALSFYNLIPSCHSCNSSDKKEKNFLITTHINPYYESFDDIYEFRISLKRILGDPIDKIDVINKGVKPDDKTHKDFHLVEKYKNCLSDTENVVDLFWKNKTRLETEDGSFLIELIMKEIPHNKNEILKYSKSKLNRDILKQLDIHNHLKIN